MAPRNRQKGALLLQLLLVVLVTSMIASGLVQSHVTAAQRTKEDQLLFVGDQYRRALVSYYNTIPPGGRRQLPQKLEQLLEDDRFPRPVQHLRRLYADPMTGRVDWVIERFGTGITGIRSTSKGVPFRVDGFPAEYRSFSRAGNYGDWVFSVGAL